MPAAWYGSEVGFHAFIPIVPSENPTIPRPRSKIEIKVSSNDRKWPVTNDLQIRLGSKNHQIWEKREILLSHPGNNFFTNSKRDESGKCPVIKMNDLFFTDIFITCLRYKF